MPVGVPKILYYWEDDLPLQWIDIYTLIFRRRLIFVMTELTGELCNQIAGMLVYIHFDDKRLESERQPEKNVDLFKKGSPESRKDSGMTEFDLAEYEKYQKFYGQRQTDFSSSEENYWFDIEAGIEKNYWIDMYTSYYEREREKNESIDYLEHPFSIASNSNFNSNANLNYDQPIERGLKKQNWSFSGKTYSEFFKVWSPILPLLSQYQDGKYFADLKFSQKLKEFFSLKNSLDLEKQKIFLNSLKNEEFLNFYIDSFNRETNYLNSFNVLDRLTFKENIKRYASIDQKKNRLSSSSSSSDLKSGNSFIQDKHLEELQSWRLQNKTKKQSQSAGDDDIFSDYLDPILNQKRVFMMINSTGGSVTSGMTIYDALQYVKAGAVTICIGMALSASSMVLAGGNIGLRFISEAGHVMIHQPEGGISGQASDVLLDAHEIMRVRKQAATIYSLASKRSSYEVLKDLDRDYFMTPQESVDYGLADEVVTRYRAEGIIAHFETDWLGEDAKQIEGFSKKIAALQDEDIEP
uniref:Clp protease proteolytic subunit n=1 Tax=Hydrocytium acuminatum TaxID=1745963 RepID=UPI002A7FBF30|nr:Clp protease proteolytic subunit [Hydrocytium acuminatum]WOR09543.1 Clp protease proteolytic subunit [Hydrocytium acuminatum]